MKNWKFRILSALLAALFLSGAGSLSCGLTVMAASGAALSGEAADSAMLTGNAAAESAIASCSTEYTGLSENQAVLAEYLIELQRLITLEKSQIEGGEEEAVSREELACQTRSETWEGSVLTQENGVNIGPSGKETYYNLNMSLIVDTMESMGIESDYWVRNDGVKMYGDYIMCAADLSVYPRGSIIETSLGTAIVCDTGSFVFNSDVSVDIATAW